MQHSVPTAHSASTFSHRKIVILMCLDVVMNKRLLLKPLFKELLPDWILNLNDLHVFCKHCTENVQYKVQTRYIKCKPSKKCAKE